MADISHNSGNVGIGTSTPLAPLHVASGNILVGRAGYIEQDVNFSGIGGAGGWGRGLYFTSGGITAGVGLLGTYTSTSHTVDSLFLAHGASPWNSGTGLYVLRNGDVGIGTTSPTAKLDVNGSVKSSTSTTPSSEANTLTTKNYVDYKAGYRSFIAGGGAQGTYGAYPAVGEFAATTTEHTKFTVNLSFVRMFSDSVLYFKVPGMIVSNTSTGSPSSPRIIARIILTLPNGSDQRYDKLVLSGSPNTLGVGVLSLSSAELTNGFTTIDLGTSSAEGIPIPGNAASLNIPATTGTYTLKSIGFYAYGNTIAAGTQVVSMSTSTSNAYDILEVYEIKQ